jgi:hypothetical protein
MILYNIYYYTMSDILIDNKKVFNSSILFLHVFGWLTKIILILFLVGFFQEKPELFLEFNFCVKIILALFLIYRFNSYRKHKIKFTELDRKVGYSTGIYILMISFIDYVNFYTDKIRNHIIIPLTSNYFTNLNKFYMFK